MSEGYDKKALEWKEEIEKEFREMKSTGLDPNNKEHVKSYQEIHGRPCTYQVTKLVLSNYMFFYKHNAYKHTEPSIWQKKQKKQA